MTDSFLLTLQVAEIMKHFRQAAEFALLSGIKVTTIDSFQVSKVDMSAENLLIFSSNRNQMIMLIDL